MMSPTMMAVRIDSLLGVWVGRGRVVGIVKDSKG